MELLQIQYFQSVAKYENITRAAKELHISQPSLSITIKRLEDELGIPLFNRKGKNIELNPYGRLFLKHAESILNQIENAKEELLELYGEKNTHISLAATASLFLSGLLRDFLAKYPDITMAQSINQKNTIEKLKNRTLDFAITSPPIDDPMIETIELLEEEIVAVIPKSHRLSKLKSIYVKELQGESFIKLTEDHTFVSTTKHLFENAGFEPNIIFEGDLFIISELLEIKKAIALSPISICIQSKNETYNILKLKDEHRTRKIALSYFKGRHLSELAKNFINFTVDYYQNSWFTIENYRAKKQQELSEV